MSIYTRTGDDGTTALYGGKRVLKCQELVDVYGSIDELNSWIGLIASQIDTTDSHEFLNAIQSDLFTIGGYLAGWGGKLSELPVRVEKMEVLIDDMETSMPKLSNFILPGGTQLGANIHVARSIARRVERQAVALAQTQKVEGEIMKYLNRLSDFLFMLARFINTKEGIVEVTWQGIDRPTKKK